MTDADTGLALQLMRLGDPVRPLAIATATTLDLWRIPHNEEVGDIAARLGLAVVPVERLLSYFATLGLVCETELGRFAAAPAVMLLDGAGEISLRESYSLFPADIRAWTHLAQGLRTGCAAWRAANGLNLWEYLALHPAEEARFAAAMGEMTELEIPWLLDAFDWCRFTTVVDVGGGRGAFAAALTQAFPQLAVTLQDLPQVLAGIGSGSLPVSVAQCSGDMFEGVPAGADAYVMKRILYSHDDSRALDLLKSVRAAMRSDSELIVVEPVRHRNSVSTYAALLDVQMLLLGGGKVRDRKEFRALFEAAALQLKRIIPTPLSALVVARPL
jgi:hypothetical protein